MHTQKDAPATHKHAPDFRVIILSVKMVIILSANDTQPRRMWRSEESLFVVTADTRFIPNKNRRRGHQEFDTSCELAAHILPGKLCMDWDPTKSNFRLSSVPGH